MIKLSLVIKKTISKSKINSELLNKIIISLKWNSKNTNPTKKDSLCKTNSWVINLTNKIHLSSKNKNSSQHLGSNKLNLNNPQKHSMKNSPLLNSNLKPNNNNSNSHNRKIPSFNKKSKRTKKITKPLETNLLSHNSIKTTTLLSNIFLKESHNMNPKWSINLKEILLLRWKIQMQIMCSKIKLFTNSKFKMTC